MKKILNVFLVLALFLAVSCKKEQFFCNFITPKDGQKFDFGEDIRVKFFTNSTEENTLLLYIDDACYKGTSEYPYTITIKAGDITSGKHTLKVVAQNHEGAQSEAAVNITVNEPPIIESPDFVDFTDGQLPSGWQTNAWYVAPVLPNFMLNCPFSLFTQTDFATVTTQKTCNYVEFYLRGYGLIDFYVDGVLVEQIYKGNEVWYEGLGWEKFGYEFPDGFHNYKWQFHSRATHPSSVNLTAISFKKF